MSLNNSIGLSLNNSIVLNVHLCDHTGMGFSLQTIIEWNSVLNNPLTYNS